MTKKSVWEGPNAFILEQLKVNSTDRLRELLVVAFVLFLLTVVLGIVE